MEGYQGPSWLDKARIQSLEVGLANYWLLAYTMHQTPYTIIFPTTL